MYTYSLYNPNGKPTDELQKIIKVKKHIDKIPNNQDYFLLHNISTCEPTGLSEADKVDFEKCGLFTKEDITADNVNEKLKKLRILNMPYGGKTIESIWEEHMADKNEIVKINNALIKLLEHGIVPLNKSNFNHLDVKDDNIVMTSDYKARLIDWGLASENDGRTVPETLTKSWRAFQYNLPVSHILFHIFIKEDHPMVTRSMTVPKITKDSPETLFKYISNIIQIQRRKDEGHYPHIVQDICNVQHIPLDTVDQPTTIIKYIEAVLSADQFRKEDDDGHIVFNGDKYFNDVFKYNVDVYGFLMAYRELLKREDMRFKVSKILFEYCYSPEYATTRIPIHKLVADLRNLNA